MLRMKENTNSNEYIYELNPMELDELRVNFVFDCVGLEVACEHSFNRTQVARGV